MKLMYSKPDYRSIEDRRSSTFGKKTPQPTPGRGPDYTRKVVRPADSRKIETIANEADKTSLPSGPNKGVSNSPPNRYSPGGMNAQVGRMKKEFSDAIRDARSAELRNTNLDRSYDAGAEERGRMKAVRSEASQALRQRDVPVGASKYYGKGGGAADSGRVNTVKSSGPGGGPLNAPARTAPSMTRSTIGSDRTVRGGRGVTAVGPRSSAAPRGSVSGPSKSTSSGKSSYGGGGRDSGGVSKSAPARGTERFAKGSLVKSKVNQAGTYTKPGMRKKLFESIKASAVQGTKAGQWSARKAQLLAKKYKAAGGGYK